MDYTINRNEAFNSLEITFDGRPAAAVRDALKALKFRWHGVKRIWYGYASEDAVKAAIDGAEVKTPTATNDDADTWKDIKGATTAPEGYKWQNNGKSRFSGDYKHRLVKTDKTTKPAEKVNKYGVKIGDIFHASWGYDQTNNDFFQVIALVGESSVRVREVNPVCEQVDGVCWAAEDRVFCTNTNGELLPPAQNSFFIKDNDKGDIKRLSRYDETSAPMFKIASYARAYKCSGDTIKVYESWYA